MTKRHTSKTENVPRDNNTGEPTDPLQANKPGYRYETAGPSEAMTTSALTKKWGLGEEDTQDGRKTRSQRNKNAHGKIPWIPAGTLERTPSGEAARKVSTPQSKVSEMPEGLDRPAEGGDRPAEDLDRPDTGGDRSKENLDLPGQGGGRLSGDLDQPGQGGGRSTEDLDRPKEGGDRSESDNKILVKQVAEIPVETIEIVGINETENLNTPDEDVSNESTTEVEELIGNKEEVPTKARKKTSKDDVTWTRVTGRSGYQSEPDVKKISKERFVRPQYFPSWAFTKPKILDGYVSEYSSLQYEDDQMVILAASVLTEESEPEPESEPGPDPAPSDSGDSKKHRKKKRSKKGGHDDAMKKLSKSHEPSRRTRSPSRPMSQVDVDYGTNRRIPVGIAESLSVSLYNKNKEKKRSKKDKHRQEQQPEQPPSNAKNKSSVPATNVSAANQPSQPPGKHAPPAPNPTPGPSNHKKKKKRRSRTPSSSSGSSGNSSPPSGSSSSSGASDSSSSSSSSARSKKRGKIRSRIKMPVPGSYDGKPDLDAFDS